jgi:hypothetical protein
MKRINVDGVLAKFHERAVEFIYENSLVADMIDDKPSNVRN